MHEAPLTQITLMDFANVVVKWSPSPGNRVLMRLTLTLNPLGSPKSTTKKLHWLPATAPAAPEADAPGPPLFTKIVLVKYPHPSVRLPLLRCR